MNAVWMRARAELRTRFAAILSLAVIVGVIGGVVIAAAAGARRTTTAYPRFLVAQNAMDTVVDITGRDPADIARIKSEVLALPQIAQSSEVVLAQGYLKIPGTHKPGNVFPIVSPDGRFGVSLNRAKILDGRMWSPGATDEIVPSSAVANDLHLHVGETVQLAPGGIFSDEASPDAARCRRLPPAQRRRCGRKPVDLHVVGIGAIPGMFAPLAGGYVPGVLVSPGFARAHPEYLPRHDVTVMVRFVHGHADGPAFRAGIRKITDALPPHTRVQLPFSQTQQSVGVQQTTRAQAIALWVLAALVAVAGLAVFGQALARQTFLESIEYPTLRSLGVSPQQLVAVGMMRAGVVGVLGGAIAAAVGYLLSPLTPTGVARLAEPHPGFAFDTVVVPLGAVAVLLLVTLLGAIPVWRAATARWTALGTAEHRGSQSPLLARLLASFPPSGKAGVRMALDPGAGRTAVPVRTATFGAAVSLVALAAALAFGASLNRLVSTPALSGWNWDTIMFAPEDPAKGQHNDEQLIALVDADPRVQGYATGTILSASVGDKGVTVEALESHRGGVGPEMIEGRPPIGLDEVALGTETMRTLHTHIGATVPMASDGGTFRMRVVGRIAAPQFFFQFTRPGQGAAISMQAAERLSPSQFQGGGALFVRFASGVDHEAVIKQYRQQVRRVFVLPVAQSSQLNSLNQVGQTPVVLAGILALMAAATLAHTLITSIRRRRHDLAILKTLGFLRGQVSATLAWQATAFGAMALAIGLPLGVIAGRWGWNVFADHLGVVPQAVVPSLIVLLAVPATILVANLLAIVPGRIASRLRPAAVLRTE